MKFAVLTCVPDPDGDDIHLVNIIVPSEGDLVHLHIHYKDLYSTPSRLIFRSAFNALLKITVFR